MLPSILIDATHLATDQPTGVEYYVQELLPHLASSLEGRATVTWIGHQATAPIGVPASVQWVYSPYRRGWGQLELRTQLQRLRPNLYFTPSGIPPVFVGTRTAMTVHDAAAIHHPEYYNRSQQFRLRTLTPWAARRAALVITPSTYVAQDVINHWKLRPERVQAIPHGLPHIAIEQRNPKGIGVTDSFILFVGRIEAKKNISILVEAFACLAADMPDIKLILAGKPGFGSGALEEQIARLSEDLQERIIRLGYVSDVEKSWLLHHAWVVAVPCAEEGFGFPALEGQLAGRPVVAANAGALPELTGLTLVDPFDGAAWAKALVNPGTAKPVEGVDWKVCGSATADALLRALAE